MSASRRKCRRCAPKRRFRDQMSACQTLADIRRQDNSLRSKTECRAYRCLECNGWHLTSQEMYAAA